MTVPFSESEHLFVRSGIGHSEAFSVNEHKASFIPQKQKKKTLLLMKVDAFSYVTVKSYSSAKVMLK